MLPVTPRSTETSIIEWLRTTNLRLRRALLYPVELRRYKVCSAGVEPACQRSKRRWLSVTSRASRRGWNRTINAGLFRPPLYHWSYPPLEQLELNATYGIRTHGIRRDRAAGTASPLKSQVKQSAPRWIRTSTELVLNQLPLPLG